VTDEAKPAEKPASPAVVAAKPAPTNNPPAAPAGGPNPPAAKKPPAPAAKPTPEPKAPPWWSTLRADPPFVAKVGLGLGMLAIVLLYWWVETRHSIKFPGPDKVFGTYKQIYGSEVKTRHTVHDLMERDIADNLTATLWRVLLGVFFAAIVGISLGVLASAYRVVAAAVSPLVIFLRSVPMGAMVPLIVILASGEGGKVLFIFLAIVAFVFSDTFKAVSSVPQRYVETAQTLGASKARIIFKVLVPLALPDIVTSLRSQFGLALGYIMLVEMLDQNKGLGALLFSGQKGGRTEEGILLLLMIALLAFVIDFVVRELQRGLFRYRQDL
jgi:ABC-type nitrate/sulfonate/bicarbonate transport system permease component